MKYLLGIFLVLASLNSLAATKFIDLSGTGSGTADGSSVANQCAGIDDADCAESAGNTYYLCNAAASGTDIDVPASGTDETARIDYDGACPGGTPGSLTLGRIFGTGRKYWGVNGLTIKGSDSGQSAIASFICETSLSASCSGREAASEGFRATNNVIHSSGKSGIEIGVVGNQTDYSATTGVVITGNKIYYPAAHGIIMSGNIVRPIEGDNYVVGANNVPTFNAWGIYASPRAGNCADGDAVDCASNWVTAGITCNGGNHTQYKLTLPVTTAGGTVIGANEVVKRIIVQSNANGHYTQENVAGCDVAGDGLGVNTTTRRWCQTSTEIHVCGSELNPPTDNNVVIVTSSYGPITMGRGDVVTATNNDGGNDDGTGIGSDIGAGNVTIEGAFVYANQGRGIEFNMCPTGCVAQSNISILNGTWGFLANNHATTTDTVSWYNNLAYKNGSEPFRISNAASAATQAYNNIAIGTGSQNCVNVAVGGGEGSNYYKDCVATNFPTAITGAEKFIAPGSTNYSGDNFKLDAGSVLCGTGLHTPNKYDFENRRRGSITNIGPFGTCYRNVTTPRSTYVTR